MLLYYHGDAGGANFVDMVGGIIPGIPGGVDSVLMIAAIMGGAVHITIIGRHPYNTTVRK